MKKPVKIEPKNSLNVEELAEQFGQALSLIDPEAYPELVLKMTKSFEELTKVNSAIRAGNEAYFAIIGNGKVSDVYLDMAEEHKQIAINKIMDPNGKIQNRIDIASTLYSSF